MKLLPDGVETAEDAEGVELVSSDILTFNTYRELSTFVWGLHNKDGWSVQVLSGKHSSGVTARLTRTPGFE